MRVERVMKDELVTILEAMRAAQSELAAYLVSTDRNAELTIALVLRYFDQLAPFMQEQDSELRPAD
jgi:hypothetical protein